MYRTGLILICLALAAPVTAEPESILVGGYRFPPFVIVESDEHTGLTIDVIDALNEIQDEYEFRFLPTSSKRRYLDHDDGIYDVILFEDERWQWSDRPVAGTRVIAWDEEVFVANHEQADDEDFFHDLKNRRLVGMLGYHYEFADHISDEEFLDTHFNILLSSSLERNLRLILANRPSLAEVAIVPRSFLNRYFLQNPEAEEQLRVSERVDQTYQLRALVREESALSVETLDGLLSKLEENGRLPELRRKYHLPPLKDSHRR